MLVSVIVPNFNHALYLEKRIESILNQTFQDFELIILDDCSTDNSKEIIEKYRVNPKVTQIIYNSFNSGSTFIQWNRGISIAKGKYVWIAESDDWAELTFLEHLLSKFEEDREIGLVYCNSKIHSNEISFSTLSDIKIDILKNHKWGTDYINNGLYEINNSLALCCSINNTSAVIFNKEILVSSNPFDKDFKYMGDWYTYLKIALTSKIAYVNNPLNNYRDHEKNTSKQAIKEYRHLKEYFLIYDWIFKNVKIENKKLVLNFFEGYTKHVYSLKNISLNKQYIYLFNVNKQLFYYMIRYKLIFGVTTMIKKILKKNRI